MFYNTKATLAESYSYIVYKCVLMHEGGVWKYFHSQGCEINNVSGPLLWIWGLIVLRMELLTGVISSGSHSKKRQVLLGKSFSLVVGSGNLGLRQGRQETHLCGKSHEGFARTENRVLGLFCQRPGSHSGLCVIRCVLTWGLKSSNQRSSWRQRRECLRGPGV